MSVFVVPCILKLNFFTRLYIQKDHGRHLF